MGWMHPISCSTCVWLGKSCLWSNAHVLHLWVLIYSPYTLILVVFGTVLPHALVTCAYVGILQCVTKSRNKLLKEISTGFMTRFPLFREINSVEKRLIRSLKCIALYVAATLLFLMTIWVLGDKKTWNNNEVLSAMLLAYSHCGINALLYIATNKHVHIGVKDIFQTDSKLPAEKLILCKDYFW